MLVLGTRLFIDPACVVMLQVEERLLRNGTVCEPISPPGQPATAGERGPERSVSRRLREIARQRNSMGVVTVHTLNNALRHEALSPAAVRALQDILEWTRLSPLPGPCLARRCAAPAIKGEHTYDPPRLVTASPGHARSLHSTSCYGNSRPEVAKLRWAVFDRIITEAKQRWTNRLIVMSGGELLAYRCDGHDLLDVVEKHTE